MRYRPTTEKRPIQFPAPWSWRLAVQLIVESQPLVQLGTPAIRPGTTYPGSLAGARGGLFAGTAGTFLLVLADNYAPSAGKLHGRAGPLDVRARADSIDLCLFKRLKNRKDRKLYRAVKSPGAKNGRRS